MYSYFSDLHVQVLAQGLLEPGEQLVGQTVTERNPWWALGFFRKTFLTLATAQRLILIEHRMAWFHQALRMHSVQSVPWANVEEARMKGFFTKKIRLRAQTLSGAIRMDMTVPNKLFGLLAPMRNNMQGAKSVVGAFAATRQLAAPATPASLPPSSYAPTQAEYAPQFAQLQQPAQQQQQQEQTAYNPPTSYAPPPAFASPPAPFTPPLFDPSPFAPQPQFAPTSTQMSAQMPAAHAHLPPPPFPPPPPMPAINAQGYTSVPPSAPRQSYPSVPPPLPPRARPNPS